MKVEERFKGARAPEGDEMAKQEVAQRFTKIWVEDGILSGERYGTPFKANFSLFLIGKALDRGCDFEDLADGYGAGMGTMGGDWSGIRDSSDEAVDKMLERSLNFLFG